jgi:hypothetical protein
MGQLVSDEEAKALGLSPPKQQSNAVTLSNEEARALGLTKPIGDENLGADTPGHNDVSGWRYGLNAMRGVGNQALNSVGNVLNIPNAFDEVVPPVGNALKGLADTQSDQQQNPGNAVGKFLFDMGIQIPTGGAGKLLPAAPALGRAIASGGVSGATADGDAIDRAKSAGLGVLGSLGGEGVAKALPYLFDIGSAVVAPFSKGGRESVMSRMLNSAVGDNAPQVARQLDNASSLVPGSLPTAAEAAPTSGGIGAVQRWAEQANPEQYAFRRAQNSSARADVLRGMAGTADEQAAAIAQRKAVTQPLYDNAKAQTVTVDQQMADMLQRPSMKTALGHVINIAAEEGKPLSPGLIAIMDGNVPTSITGEELHRLKIGLDSVLNDPKNPLAKEQANALKSTIKKFEGWRETNIPDYAKAQQAFAELSKPINQQQVAGALYNKAKPALTDYGPLSRESSQTYANALRDSKPLVKKATGFKGATLDNVMGPENQAYLESVARDMARRTAADEVGRGIGSNTFQNMAMDNLGKSVGAVPIGILGMLNHLPGSGYLGSVLSSPMKNSDQIMKEALSEILLDPKKTSELLRKTQGESAIRKFLNRSSIGAGRLGVVVANQK